MSYQKQAWRDYDDAKTELQNLQNGAVVTPERMNHIETGIANSADKQEVTTQLAQTDNKISDVISLSNYAHLINTETVEPDWSPAIKQAIIDAKELSSEVLFPKQRITYYESMEIPQEVKIRGFGEGLDGTILDYRGTEYAIKTSGTMQKNQLRDFRLNLNRGSNGILIGADGATLDQLGRIIPTAFTLQNIAVSDIGDEFIGVHILNASHYFFQNVRCGYGNSSGFGFVIEAEGFPNLDGSITNINAGVGTFIDCSIGRVDATVVGLETRGTQNLDTFEFIGCYFGGKTPIKIGETSTVRNFNISGSHIEGRNIGNTVNMIEIHGLIGGTFKGVTFGGFKEQNTNAFVFKGRVENLTVLGGEVNGIMGTIFKEDGATLVENCLLQSPVKTNGSTATNFSETLSQYNFKFDDRRFETRNIRVRTLFSIDGGNKEYWADAPDKTLAHSKGDIIKNTNVNRQKNITHWKCIRDGSGENALFMAYGTGWGTGSERPPLNADDNGYMYFDTTLGQLIVWDGEKWLS